MSRGINAGTAAERNPRDSSKRAAVWAARPILESAQLPLSVQLIALTLVGVAIYVGLSFLVNGVASREFLDTLRETIRPKAAKKSAV